MCSWPAGPLVPFEVRYDQSNRLSYPTAGLFSRFDGTLSTGSCRFRGYDARDEQAKAARHAARVVLSITHTHNFLNPPQNIVEVDKVCVLAPRRAQRYLLLFGERATKHGGRERTRPFPPLPLRPSAATLPTAEPEAAADAARREDSYLAAASLATQHAPNSGCCLVLALTPTFLPRTHPRMGSLEAVRSITNRKTLPPCRLRVVAPPVVVNSPASVVFFSTLLHPPGPGAQQLVASRGVLRAWFVRHSLVLAPAGVQRDGTHVPARPHTAVSRFRAPNS